MFKYILLSASFIFLIINFSYSKPSPTNLKNSLDLNFTGKVNFSLPLDLNKLNFKGELNISNIKIKGDFSVKIINKNPFIGTITSNYLKLDINEFIIILNKLGINVSIPQNIKGSVILEKINLNLKDDTYSLQIDKITGPVIYNKKLLLNNFNITGDIKKRILNLNIHKIILDTNTITNLVVNNEKSILISFSDSYFNLNYIRNLAFTLIPDLHKKIINFIKERNTYVPEVSNIDLKGNINLNNFNLEITKELNILNLNCVLSLNKTTVILNNAKKSPLILNLSSNSINVLYKNKTCDIATTKINLNLKNIYLQNKITNIKTKYFYIPDIKLDVGFKSKINTENSTRSYFNIHVIPKTNLVLNIDKKSHLLLNILPFDLEMQNNIFTLSNNKEVYVNLKDLPVYLSKNKTLKISGKIKLKDNNFGINLEKNYFNLKSNVSISNSNILIRNTNINIANFSLNIKLSNNILDLTNGYLKAKLNHNGNIILYFNTSMPFRNFSAKIREIYKNTTLNLQLKDTNIYGTKIKTLKVIKQNNYLAKLNYDISLQSLKLIGNTSIHLSNNKNDIITRKLLLIDITKKENHKKVNGQDTPIKIEVPEIIKNLSSKYHFEFDLINYIKKDTEYLISSVKGNILLKDHPAIGLSGYFCNMLFSGGGEYKNGEVLATMDVRAISLPVDHLIACFINKAPIYITGNTNLQGTVNTQGKTIKGLKRHLSFDILIDIDNGRVMKLSNLGKKIKWILDILSYVKLNPSKLEDSLEFKKIIASISGGFNKVNIKQIKVYSPMLNLYSYGEINLDKKEINLKGFIKKGFLSKKFHFKEKLSKNNNKE